MIFLPRLLSLISSFLQVKTGFHISALEQRAATASQEARNSLGVLLPPCLQSVSVLPPRLGGERGRCYSRQLARERLPLLPRPVATFCIMSTAWIWSVSAPLQTGRVEGRIQWAKSCLKLYLALAHPVTWEGARCFVSGGVAQTGDRLQLGQLRTGRWGLWLLGRAVQSEQGSKTEPSSRDGATARRQLSAFHSCLGIHGCVPEYMCMYVY